MDGDRGPQCKKVLQSHSCEGLPPLDLTRTARASPVSYNELEPGASHYSKQNHRPASSSADPNGGEGAHSKKPTASSQSYNLLSEHPPRRPLCDAERGRVVGIMHEGFGARRKVFLSGLPTNYTDKVPHRNCSWILLELFSISFVSISQSLANFLKEYSCATVSRVKDGSGILLICVQSPFLSNISLPSSPHRPSSAAFHGSSEGKTRASATECNQVRRTQTDGSVWPSGLLPVCGQPPLHAHQ